MNGPRPNRHLQGAELVWFDFDPSAFAERARAQSADYPGLDARLGSCRRAAWSCDSYLRLARPSGTGRVVTNVLWEGGEDLAVDLDRDGNPLGIEFLARLPCRSDKG